MSVPVSLSTEKCKPDDGGRVMRRMILDGLVIRHEDTQCYIGCDPATHITNTSNVATEIFTAHKLMVQLPLSVR
jgi:hypothetical protein